MGQRKLRTQARSTVIATERSGWFFLFRGIWSASSEPPSLLRCSLVNTIFFGYRQLSTIVTASDRIFDVNDCTNTGLRRSSPDWAATGRRPFVLLHTLRVTPQASACSTEPAIQYHKFYDLAACTQSTRLSLQVNAISRTQTAQPRVRLKTSEQTLPLSGV